MIDMRPTILAKSDQLNADDLIGGPMTITITDVRLLEAADQPVAIHWEGGDGRPFKPCKSMRRVMAKVWGEDGKAFIGQRMTVFRDDKVRFGSDAVGGIRISHMSGIDREISMALMVTRGKRAPYSVRPLTGDSRPVDMVDVAGVIAAGRTAASQGKDALNAWWKGLSQAARAAAKPTLDAELIDAAKRADTPGADQGDDIDFNSSSDSDGLAGVAVEGEQGSAEASGPSVDGSLARTPSDAFPGDQPATTGPTLAQKVQAFKDRCCEAPSLIKLRSIGNAAAALRKELDAKDPEMLADLDRWFEERLQLVEAAEREAGA